MRSSHLLCVRGAMLVGLAIAATRCATDDPSQLTTEERSPATTLNGTWLYYPLDRITNPGYAGYCGYGCGGDNHFAYDLRGNVGDVVRAASGGTITVYGGCNELSTCTTNTAQADVNCHGACGNWAIIQHPNGKFTKYCHLHTITVGNGPVSLGQQIGTVGHTGSANLCVNGGFAPHLHFAVSSSLSGTGAVPYSGCVLYNSNGNCIDPGVPPGGSTNDCGCTTTPKNLWVQVGGTVVLASCTPLSSDADICAENSRLGNTACGPYYLNNCGSVVDCGACTAPGTYCNAGICNNTPPSCPTTAPCGYRTGWCGVGAYCGSSGILNGVANTLYQCNAPGGPAAVINTCGGYECIFRPGLDDVCALGPPTCPVNGNGWYGAGLYCGLAQGMVYAEPYDVYYCGCAGCRASVSKTCSANCVVAPPGSNDHC